jgi:hypothetical protein
MMEEIIAFVVVVVVVEIGAVIDGRSRSRPLGRQFAAIRQIRLGNADF